MAAVTVAEEAAAAEAAEAAAAFLTNRFSCKRAIKALLHIYQRSPFQLALSSFNKFSIDSK